MHSNSNCNRSLSPVASNDYNFEQPKSCNEVLWDTDSSQGYSSAKVSELTKVFIVLRISCLEIECKRPFSVSVKIQRGDLTTANRCTSTYCSRWQDRGQRGFHKHYCGTKRYHSIWLKEMLWARIMHAVPPVRAIEFHPVGFHKISSFTNILTSPFLMYSFHHGIGFNKLIRNPETIPGGFIL